MLRPRDIMRCLAATLPLAATTIIAAAAHDPTPPSGTPSALMPAAADRQPDAASVVSAYTKVRKWVSAFETPRMDDANSTVNMDGAAGVCVILRRSGRVLGIGVDTVGDNLMARRAAGKAMNDVLTDPALQSIAAQLAQDTKKHPDQALTIEAVRAALGRGLTVEIEVAGRLAPLLGRTPDAMARKIEPGVDGVALRRGQAWEYRFPSQLRATNTGADPDKVLLNLALSAGLTIKDAESLGQHEDVGVYSFQTLDLAQLDVDQAPTLLVRGGTLVPASAVTRQSIAALADGLARHILASRFPDPPASPGSDGTNGPAPSKPMGITGNYSIVADENRPMLAPPAEQAMAAFALARYAQGKSSDPALAAAAAQATTGIFRDLAVLGSAADRAPLDPAANAAIVYAVSALPDSRSDAAVDHLFQSAAQAVLATFDAQRGFLPVPAAPASAKAPAKSIPLPAHTQAMLAGAMSRLAAMKGPNHPAIDHATLRKAIDAAWDSTPPAQQIALLPWIGWAETDCAAATGSPPAHLDRLIALRELIGEIQVGSGSRPAAAELQGGLGLTGESGGEATPRPTAQTVRPASWLAGAVGNPLITPAEKRAASVATLRGIMRFLMQLSVRPAESGLVRNPARAVGGIRAALWNSDQPVPAQALGLLAAVETLENMEPQPPAPVEH